MSGEQVLVVPRRAVPNAAGWHGIREGGMEAFLEVVRARGRFVARDLAEHDPDLKQVIPYLVLRDGPCYFLMQRTRAGADARLHDRWSIGVGGHLNPGDVDVLGGLRREWGEELVTEFIPEFQPVGLLNDDTTEVGAVHLGAVFVAEAAGRPVSVRETDKLAGRFAEPTEVAAVADDLETWSRMCFEFLEGAAVR
ncbi:MAG: NUDIX hydrolase [Chloroflexota bacterium]